MKIGISLGSGSFKGVCHLGFIKALEEEGIIPDVIVGSSIGAVIGALWASGKSADDIIEIFKQMGSRNFLRYISFSVSRRGIIEPRIEDFLKGHIGTKNFEDMKVKLIVMATDITNGERVKIVEGSVLKAVRRSISIPGIMHPVIEGESVIIDGGVLAPLPLKELFDEGCSEIFASSLTPEDHRKVLPTTFEKISRMTRQKLEEIFKVEIGDPSLTIYSIIKRSMVLMNIELENWELRFFKPKILVRYPIDDLDISALDRIDEYVELSYRKTKEALRNL
ncbi:patatin-like phospholipase family protein [Fervidobacterium sp.]